MKPMYLVILGVCAIILIGVLWMTFSGGPPDPDSLAATALGSGNVKVKAKAASQLSMLQGKKVVPLLRKIAKESKDGEVVVVAIGTLSDRHEMANLPFFYAAMDHPDKAAREAGYKAALKVYQGSLPDGTLPGNVKYDVEAPPEERAKAVQKLQEIYKEEEENPAPRNKGKD